MTTVAVEVRRAVRIPIGLQILAAANLEALAVAHAAALISCGRNILRMPTSRMKA